MTVCTLYDYYQLKLDIKQQVQLYYMYEFMEVEHLLS